MSLIKVIQDQIAKSLFPKGMVPRELLDMASYFRTNKAINFEFKKSEDGTIIAISTNFRYGSIVTSGKNEDDLEKNIKDAILTSFDVSSAYAKEAAIHREGKASEGAYALS